MRILRVEVLRVIMVILWSLDDRIELMKWAGYYKLNSYFYAPKNDPKHNQKWKELYTVKQEINDLIKPLLWP